MQRVNTMEQIIYCLGFFDGVHLGHQALIHACTELAGRYAMASGAVTFSGHPDTLVCGVTPRQINTDADRKMLLRQELAHVVQLPFDRALMQMQWQDFLAMLRREYAAAGFVCGSDFRFGAGGRADAAALAGYCRREALPFAVVEEQRLDGVRICSTHIRTLLEQGNMPEAARFLGHHHMFSGTVCAGKQLGRTLQFPTANLAYPEGLVQLPYGVYACRVHCGQSCYEAVTNIGIRPTVSGQGVTVESHLIAYSGDLYGKHITVEFVKFLRPERKFESLAALQTQIFRDIQNAQQV